MSEWFTWLQFGVAVVAGLICVIAGIRKQLPSDLTAGAVALVGVLTIVQLVMAIVAPMFGNAMRGDGLEYWMYLITAALLPPAAIFLALIERSRWANYVLAIAAFAVAVMIVRMQQIWLGAGSFLG